MSIPEEGIARAVEILRTGRLTRYGEDTQGGSETSRFEVEFAELVERKYAVGVNSCGCSLFLALRALRAQPGDPICVMPSRLPLSRGRLLMPLVARSWWISPTICRLT